VLHHGFDELARELRRSGYASSFDADPGLVLYRSLIAVAHADTDRRHVVHEEVGEVLRADHHQRIGPRGFDCLPHALECRIEGVPNRGLCALAAAGDARGMTADTGEDQTHGAT